MKKPEIEPGLIPIHSNEESTKPVDEFFIEEVWVRLQEGSNFYCQPQVEVTRQKNAATPHK